jgi:hypothetical protein
MRSLKLDVGSLKVESFPVAEGIEPHRLAAGDSERPRDCSYFPVCPGGPPVP